VGEGAPVGAGATAGVGVFSLLDDTDDTGGGEPEVGNPDVGSRKDMMG